MVVGRVGGGGEHRGRMTGGATCARSENDESLENDHKVRQGYWPGTVKNVVGTGGQPRSS